MARQAPDRFTGKSLTTAVKLDVSSLPYLSSIYPSSRSAAVRLCIADHARVATILRDPDMTDAEKLQRLYALMPHAVAYMEKVRAERADFEQRYAEG